MQPPTMKTGQLLGSRQLSAPWVLTSDGPTVEHPRNLGCGISGEAEVGKSGGLGVAVRRGLSGGLGVGGCRLRGLRGVRVG